ncbi:YwqG family protein [Hymenobacter tibetensis]|uniref:YwqG family protein n=1 Tax=Hymenobacter tibetensis TaxID=497967 RepID=A0ABY4CSH2_9BACT|nr:YwqG family protein [Hymenobacter tibetensis]UOG73012.1 YwqG family protein [Hymenobacter tibetensis]
MIPDFLAPFATQLEQYKLESIKIMAKPLKTDLCVSIASNFGGLPYLPFAAQYPTEPNGKPLLLLAQINLSELPTNDLLPKDGLLQFYMPAHDWGYTDYARVLYISFDQLQTEIRTDYSFLLPTHYKDSPIACEHKLIFEKTFEYGATQDCRFGANFNGLDSHEFVDTLTKVEQDIFYGFLSSNGHKLGGYASFTQDDPRENDSQSGIDVQLLQIDVDKKIMFGDAGIAHFFINEQALKDGRFKEAYFYWDCC